MRLSILLLTLILIALGCNVYAVADRVQSAERKQHKIEAGITDEQEGIRVLSAEWTYLTNPDRLEKLATANFGLVPSDGQQYVELAAIPLRDFMDKQTQDEAPQLAANTVKPVVKAAPAPALIHETTALPPQVLQALSDLTATPVSMTASAAHE